MDQPSVRRSPNFRHGLRLVADHNPFFLISGLLMLVGCFTINGAAHGDPSAIWPIAGLILLFNLYEALVVGLAVYLSGPRRLYRDAACLILLEALLLCDVSLAYSELMMKSLPMVLRFVSGSASPSSASMNISAASTATNGMS